MKICMVCDNIFPAHGGRGVTTERWAQKLVERGHEVAIFASRKTGQPKREIIKGITIYRFSSVCLPKTNKALYVGFPFPPNIFKIMKREKFDVVHYNIQDYLAFLCILAAKKLNIPLVAGLHTQPENISKTLNVSASFVDKEIFKIFISLCNYANLTIIPTKFGAKVALAHGLTSKCSVVSNGIEYKDFDKVSKKLFKEEYKLKDEKLMMYVGRLVKEKNVDFLIKILPPVLKKCPETKLVIVGSGYMEKELKRQIRNKNLQDKVILTGRISDELLSSSYKAIDLFILPSSVELQGLVVLEAMASGKPVMVAKASTSAAYELVEEGKNGYTFSLAKKKEAADKIARIFKDSSLRKKMGQESLKLVKKHSIEKSIDKIEKIYSRLIKG